jgi:hypothetical protein
MQQREWKARTKRDLIIEVWEDLDCESIGARELMAIEIVVRERFGAGAVEPPTRVARLLADEGAELRHAEILELDVKHRETDPYRGLLSDALKFSNLERAVTSLERLEDLRLQFTHGGDQEGVRRLRDAATKSRQRVLSISRNVDTDETRRAEKAEIAEWLRVWLQQPEIFRDWLDLRRRSKDFVGRFAIDGSL